MTAAELVARWERIARAPVALDDDDWLNDVDVRELLHGLDPAELIPYRERLRLADARFRAATRAVPECVWGADNAAAHGWTPHRNWWYWRVPAGSDQAG